MQYNCRNTPNNIYVGSFSSLLGQLNYFRRLCKGLQVSLGGQEFPFGISD